jgi:hypothetical protein
MLERKVKEGWKEPKVKTEYEVLILFGILIVAVLNL